MSTDHRAWLVLDTNGAIALASHDRLELAAEAYRLCGPRLLWSECVNVLHRDAHRIGRSGELERRVLDQILAAPIEQVDTYDRSEPWDIADLLGWAKTYDAEYLAAARHASAGLFTLDNQLRSGAERLGIELVVPE